MPLSPEPTPKVIRIGRHYPATSKTFGPVTATVDKAVKGQYGWELWFTDTLGFTYHVEDTTEPGIELTILKWTE